MNRSDPLAALNRLLHLMLRSFVAYSMEVRRVTYCGSEELRDLLVEVAEEQAALAERIADAIRASHGAPEPGPFPISFTAWNDVALPKVAERALVLLRKSLAEASEIAEAHPQPPTFHFAKEVANLTTRHIAQLEDALNPKPTTLA